MKKNLLLLLLTFALGVGVMRACEWSGAIPPAQKTFTCQRKTCADIATCEEAVHLLEVCGFTRLDQNGDGVPCERLCQHFTAKSHFTAKTRRREGE